MKVSFSQHCSNYVLMLFSNLVLRSKLVYHKALFWILCWHTSARFFIRKSGMDRMYLAQERDKWQAVVNTAPNLWGYIKCSSFLK
jgi:hypothetical protein